MTFDIKFDYRFDNANFFTNEKKAILEQAGEIWSSYIQDEFTAIPAGKKLKFQINGVEKEVILNEPIDDLIIFVSSKETGNSGNLVLSEGAYFAEFILGSEQAQRIQGNNFEPWLGTIEFNASVTDNFYFDSTPESDDDIPFDKQDFLSLSLHEIGHVLGIGISPIFDQQVKNAKFTGTQSVKLNGNQPVPLDGDLTHIRDGYTLDNDNDADALLDKSFTFGERNLPTDLDLAMLSDIGYDVIAYDAVPVFRFFQYEQGFHFYTADENEKEAVIDRAQKGELDYKLENVAFRVLGSDRDSLTGDKIEGALPVYRFFNRDTGSHLYTMDENEKNNIQAKLSNYSFDGINYYAFASEPQDIETVPLYRLYNTTSGSHLFTTDANEFNTIKNNEDFSHFNVEGNQGITYYVIESF
jgi:hypothetical protein